MINLYNYLEETAYPGRGIIIGKSGDNLIFVYFIMGRSENSQNRIFEKTADGIRTKAFDESKLTDPSLVIYSPVRKYGNNIIVTNGDQTDTIYDCLAAGRTFEDALDTRTFEPDPPILTPRISGIIILTEDTFSYKLSILKSDDVNEKHVLRYIYKFEAPQSGYGHFIHTYNHNEKTPPSFMGEPRKTAIDKDFNKFAELIWDNLNPEYKVALYAYSYNLKSREEKEIIYNKHQ